MADNNLLNVTISPEHEFFEPIKRINNQDDVNEWIKSGAFSRLMRFIEVLNESVINRKNSETCHVSEVGV